MITPEMLVAALHASEVGTGGHIGGWSDGGVNMGIDAYFNLHDMADHLNRSAWRDVATDPPPMNEDALFFWQNIYPGDSSRTCGMTVGAIEQDGLIHDPEGGHPMALFTKWQSLPPHPGDE